MKSNTKLVILAGGIGRRLRPFTLYVPKPMLPLGDKPILSHIIDWASHEGLKEIIIATAYLGKIIEDYFGDGRDYGIDIKYARSNRPLSSGGQLKTVEEMIERTFILSYSDIVTDLHINPLLEFHSNNRSKATIVARRHEIPFRFGELKLGELGRLQEWEEKPIISRLVNAGIFVMEPDIFTFIGKNEAVSMDIVIRRMMAKDLPVFVYDSSAKFIDVGDQESYEKANEHYVKLLEEI